MVQMTPWYAGKTHEPAHAGWYLATHEQRKDSWVSCINVLCHWDGEKWSRPMGWPSRADGKPAMVLDSNCRIVAPKVDDYYLTEQVSKPVVVKLWRGLTARLH